MNLAIPELFTVAASRVALLLVMSKQFVVQARTRYFLSMVVDIPSVQLQKMVYLDSARLLYKHGYTDPASA